MLENILYYETQILPARNCFTHLFHTWAEDLCDFSLGAVCVRNFFNQVYCQTLGLLVAVVRFLHFNEHRNVAMSVIFIILTFFLHTFYSA